MSKNKVYLFAVFDLNDYNYLKMPWRIIVEVIPALSKTMPDSTFYVLTDSKPVLKLRKILEESNNVKVISTSIPVLRYPYKGLNETVATLRRRLNVEALVVFSGVNPFVWIRIARANGIRALVLIFLTPIYTWKELAVIVTKYVPKLLRYGTPSDMLDLLKLFYENAIARFVLPVSFKLGLDNGLKVSAIVMHDNALGLFKKLKLDAHKAIPRLVYAGRRRERGHSGAKKDLRIAYFGPLILARGYDIVVELSRRLPEDPPLVVS